MSSDDYTTVQVKIPKNVAQDTTFFSNFNGFSFKDALAIFICAPFIGAITLYLISYVKHGTNLSDLLLLIDNLRYTVGIVLGGYFVQETTTAVSNYMSRRREVTVADIGVSTHTEADPYPAELGKE